MWENHCPGEKECKYLQSVLLPWWVDHTFRSEDWWVSRMVTWYFLWHYIKYTWQHVACLLNGALLNQQLQGAVLVSFIDCQSVSNRFRLRLRIANDGVDILCVLDAIQCVCTTALSNSRTSLDCHHGWKLVDQPYFRNVHHTCIYWATYPCP